MSKHSIKAALSAATCVLLGSGSSTASADGYETDVGASSLLYSELGRVTVNENTVKFKKEVKDNEFITGKYAIDVMSGASPSGAATVQGTTQTLTSPSGRTTTITNEETPTFEFKDTRHAFILGWIKPLSRTNTLSLDGNFSIEKDYSSSGVSATYSSDFNSRRTTLTLGLSGSADKVVPQHGVPVGLTSLNWASTEGKQGSKSLVDGVVGITQVLNKNSLLLVNYSIGSSSGYLTDPYKIVSYIDSATLRPRTGDDGYFLEKRPSERLRQSVYSRFFYGEMGQVSDVSYRYFWDDWGVTSHTIDFHYEFDLDHGMALQWHGRIYSQTRADFYHYALYDDPVEGVAARDVTDDPSSLYAASGDYRLGNMNSYTFGAKLTYPTRYGVFSGRAEYFTQQDRDNKFLTMHALITQIIWRLKFF